MSPNDSAPPGTGGQALGDATIKAKGRIHIGHELRLIQAQARPAVAAGFHFIGGRPNDGLLAAVDDATAFTRTGELPAQRLEHSFVATPDDVYIKKAGLTTSYGIFGAPRAGKTHLLMYLLRQLMALNATDPEQKFGALILDPKAALIEDVRAAAAQAGRESDLVVLNSDELARRGEAVNVIDCTLDPLELGRMLVLAAQSAGTGASEPFWFGAWTNLFGAAVYLLQWLDTDVLTLQRLLDATLLVETYDKDGRPQREIQRLAADARERLNELPQDRQRDARQAISQVEGFYRQEPDNIATVESLITQAYGGFQQSRWSRYSQAAPKIRGEHRTPFYDQIVDDGKIVLVSVSPSDPGMAKVLCTLVKCLFQMTVVGRLARVRAGTLKNFKRPLVLAVDEYSEVASEVPGQPMGDGYFFSVCRQNGCMGLIATQSVNVLQASSLKENWKSVFSTFGAKIFMRLADKETIEEAAALVGETDWYLTSTGTSRQKDGSGSSTQKELRERKLTASVFTDVMGRREGMIVGSLDGGKTQDVRFVRVPDDEEQDEAIKKAQKKDRDDAA